MPEWFEKWFGSTYLEMYPHRDEKDAATVVTLVAATVRLKNQHVLDLACGPGRHAELLRAREANVVGIDLSMPLLMRANELYDPPIPVVRGDMRYLPFQKACFDVVVNLFTSFGYFESDREHVGVLRDVARVLKSRGSFVLDFLNASFVKSRLVEDEEQTIGEKKVTIHRRISEDGRFVFKEMNLVEEGRSFIERVRLFSPKELECLLAETGFSVQERFGSYDGDRLTTESPRVILFAEQK